MFENFYLIDNWCMLHMLSSDAVLYQIVCQLFVCTAHLIDCQPAQTFWEWICILPFQRFIHFRVNHLDRRLIFFLLNQKMHEEIWASFNHRKLQAWEGLTVAEEQKREKTFEKNDFNLIEYPCDWGIWNHSHTHSLCKYPCGNFRLIFPN